MGAPSPQATRERLHDAYRVICADGSRHIVYNAAAIGNPSDHVPDKWYVLPCPLTPEGLGFISPPFDTAGDAERAIRSRHNAAHGLS